MSVIHIKHRHVLPHDETYRRVEKIAKYLKKKYKVDYSLDGNLLKSRHKGSFVVVYLGDGCIELKIKLCLLFAPMKGRIEKAIRKNLHSAIGDSKCAPERAIISENL